MGICFATPKSLDDDTGAEYGNFEVDGGVISTPNLKVFSLKELKAATGNFGEDRKIGEDGFGKVFKGWVDENTFGPMKPDHGLAVAVKKWDSSGFQGFEEWENEIKLLGQLSHPNIIKLIGYCSENEQLLLVYEYMEKENLEKHLFQSKGKSLPWILRIKIAMQAAKALSFLHTLEKSVIYRDFKTSSILLDTEYNVKLSNFGFAKFGPINEELHISTRVLDTYGYAAPEYIMTGHLNVKCDVYGFGVVLLEILTGLRIVDKNRSPKQVNLVEWTQPYLNSESNVKKIVDPRLENQYPLEAAIQTAKLVKRCLERDPANRPSMREASIILDRISQISL